MNNITSQLPFTGFLSRHNSQPDYYAAAYTREQSVSSRESLDAGLVIETSDGDLVTLTASSYNELNAFSYDSGGVARSESGLALYGVNEREISLASGQQFSFSVSGDLSEEELEDIDAILKGLDGVISEMKDGDMGGVLKKALDLDDFDTISSFSADITYQRSLEVSSAVAATAVGSFPASGTVLEGGGVSSGDPAAVEGSLLPGTGLNSFDIDFADFLERILEQFEGRDERRLGLARKPVAELFQHHLDIIDEKNGMGPLRSILQRGLESFDGLFAELTDQK